MDGLDFRRRNCPRRLGGLWFFWEKVAVWWSKPQQPSPTQPSEGLVDFNYPRDSGLQARLKGEGYTVSWCSRGNLARKLDVEGYRYALEERPGCGTVRLTAGAMVLIKKRR